MGRPGTCISGVRRGGPQDRVATRTCPPATGAIHCIKLTLLDVPKSTQADSVGMTGGPRGRIKHILGQVWLVTKYNKVT